MRWRRYAGAVAFCMVTGMSCAVRLRTVNKTAVYDNIGCASAKFVRHASQSQGACRGSRVQADASGAKTSYGAMGDLRSFRMEAPLKFDVECLTAYGASGWTLLPWSMRALGSAAGRKTQSQLSS
jgi:hypothetical protein